MDCTLVNFFNRTLEYEGVRGKELNKSEKEQTKSISVSMLEESKKDRLRIDNWSEKTETSATVVTYVRDTLFEKLLIQPMNSMILNINQIVSMSI